MLAQWFAAVLGFWVGNYRSVKGYILRFHVGVIYHRETVSNVEIDKFFSKKQELDVAMSVQNGEKLSPRSIWREVTTI